MIRIFLTGASGNVGRSIVCYVQEQEDVRLVGGWGREAGEDIGTLAGLAPLGLKLAGDLEAALTATRPDVVIDFSNQTVLADNLQLYLRQGLDAVVGATGLTDEQLSPLRERVAQQGLRWAVIPNFGLGMSLISAFVRQARQFYPYVTIIDRHPAAMANAPSGTAAALAQEAAGSGLPLGQAASTPVYPGVLGADIAGVPVFSERLPWPGPYSGHEVTLARQDEIVRISLEAYTSDIYMEGVFLTVRKLGSLPAGAFVRSLAEIMEA